MGCSAAAVRQDPLPGGLRTEQGANDCSCAPAPGAKWQLPSTGPAPADWFCWGTLAAGQTLDAARDAGSCRSGTQVLGAGVGSLPGAAGLGGSCVPGLAHRESIGETSQVMNCSVEHLGGARVLRESPGLAGHRPHGLGRECCRGGTQSHLAKALSGT